MARWGYPRRDTAMLEARRFEGAALLLRGMTQREVAHRLGVSFTAVWSWRRRLHSHGVEGLRARRRPGRPPKVDRMIQADLARILATDPIARGHTAGAWTLDRLASELTVHWGVTYSRGAIWRILRQQGFRWKGAGSSDRSRNGAIRQAAVDAQSGWSPGPRLILLIRSRNQRTARQVKPGRRRERQLTLPR